jgi:hypothetical protein
VEQAIKRSETAMKQAVFWVKHHLEAKSAGKGELA